MKYFFPLLIIFFFSGCRTVDIRLPDYETAAERSFFSGKFDYPFSEPHIVINRKEPANIVGGAVLDNVFYSRDTGKTWHKNKLQSRYGVYGDPVLISDSRGRVYYFHLASGLRKGGHWLEGIVMQYSDDGGTTWNDGILIGKNGEKQQDKPWPAVDSKTQRLALAWTEFDKYGSKNPEDKSRILISFSDDQGENWSKPLRINDIEGDCLDDDKTVEGAVPLFDNDGNVYVVWAYDGKIWLDYSTDGGKTWHKDQPIAEQEAGWSFDVEGIYRTNGLPNFKMDDKENFYVIFGDYNEETGADIKMIYSKNKGKTWHGPQLLGDVNRDQFFPAFSLDKHGNIIMLYYDRSQTKGPLTEVKLLFYNPARKTRKILEMSEKPFVPVKDVFFGDYIGLDYYKGIIAAVWTEISDKKSTALKIKIIK